jgi:D-sedoheptulose 7-phosphate isomerase
MKDIIIKNFRESSLLIQQSGEIFADKIMQISDALIEVYIRKNKLLIAGNGGSAADAQHISGELVNKFYHDREAFSAIALSTDTSILTSWANDKHFDYVFERQVEAHGKEGDALMVLSTSGNSQNLVNAVHKAKEKHMITISLLGKNGGRLKGLCDYEIIIPHSDTARIQEAHKVIYHTICQLIEQAFLK